MRLRSAVFSVVAVTLSSLPAVAGQKYKGFERGEGLIPVQELQQLIDAKDPKLVVLAVVEPASYTAGHIPGSINIWRPDYELKVGEPYPFEGMLLEREGFQAFARGLGIDNDSRVVVYDEKYDAPRLWWAFYLYGKTDVRVLDGGYPAWKAAGYGVDMSPSRGTGAGTGHFVAKERRPRWVASMDDVRRGRTSKDVRVWDTREPEEWTGAQKKGNARRAGRVPWAAFQSWKEYRLQIEGDWERAAQVWTDLGCPYDAAMALLDATQDAALRRALSTFHDLGAKAATGITREKMRVLGIRSIPTGPRSATRTHPLRLTQREREVLDLICGGHTNAEIAGRLFISAKTVDHHVSAVLAKLDAPTRDVAASLAVRLGLVGVAEI